MDSFPFLQAGCQTSVQRTKVHVLRAKMHWRIEKFDKLLSLAQPGKVVENQKFNSGRGADDFIWHLEIHLIDYPASGNRTSGKDGKILLQIHKSSPSTNAVSANVKFFPGPPTEFPLQAGWPLIRRSWVAARATAQARIPLTDFTLNIPEKQNSFTLCGEFLRKAVQSNGMLAVQCEMEYLQPGISCTTLVADKSKQRKLMEKPLPEFLGHNFKTLFEQGAYSDFALLVDGRKIPCHRFVLASHSDVFRAMFDSENMVEARQGYADLSKIVSEASIRAMLHFVYTGALEESTDAKRENFEELLKLAHMYDLPLLKSVCEEHLTKNVTVENACKMLCAGDTYEAAQLRDAAMKCIKENENTILESDEWRQLKAKNPHLTTSVLEVVLGGSGTTRSLSAPYPGSTVPRQSRTVDVFTGNVGEFLRSSFRGIRKKV